MAVEADDLRTQLETAFKAQREEPQTHEAPIADPADTPPPQDLTPSESRPRDDRGRFVSGGEKPKEQAEAASVESVAKPVEAAAIEQPAAPAEQKPLAHAPPNGWTAEAKAKWHELSPEVQAAVAQREKDIAKFTGKTDEERAFGRDMQRAINPYLPVIRAAGANPVEAVSALLNTAYILRAGTPQQKQQAIMQVCREYGVDLSNAQQPEAVHPHIAQLQHEIAGLKQQLASGQQQSTQQTQAEIQSELEAFAADPTHSHFQEVKAHMAALLGNGLAKDLQDAYEQACHARPDIRATLLAQTRAQEEQKRRSEEKARAEAARAKAISITGGPGNTAAKSAPADRDLRDELTANYRASTGAV